VWSLLMCSGLVWEDDWGASIPAPPTATQRTTPVISGRKQTSSSVSSAGMSGSGVGVGFVPMATVSELSDDLHAVTDATAIGDLDTRLSEVAFASDMAGSGSGSGVRGRSTAMDKEWRQSEVTFPSPASCRTTITSTTSTASGSAGNTSGRIISGDGRDEGCPPVYSQEESHQHKEGGSSRASRFRAL
jgi:hypothetical protein